MMYIFVSLNHLFIIVCCFHNNIRIEEGFKKDDYIFDLFHRRFQNKK